ncbi:MAG: complex I subunit 4 family protein [Conexivisphaera sp.]
MIASIPVLWALVALPIIVGVAAWLSGDRWRSAYAYLSALTLLVPLGAVAYLYWSGAGDLVDPIGFNLTSYRMGHFLLAIDGLSAPVVVALSIVTAFVSIYGLKYMEHRIEEMRSSGETPPDYGAYQFLYNVFAATMMGVAFSTNLVEFYVFLEGTLISSFLLIMYYGYGDRSRISMLYFVWTHVGAVTFLAGALYYGVVEGSFDYLKPLGTSLETVGPATALGPMAAVVALLMFVGLAVKMALFGVHMWLPYAHAEAPTPISALLSPSLIGLAGYAMARFLIQYFPSIMYQWRPYLMALAFVTIVYAGLNALRQSDFKRLLAYSSISQMGYMLLGIATLTQFGIIGSMLMYVSHAIGKALLFMTAGVFITEAHNLRDIGRMGGLARRYPLVASLALFGFMNLSGLPPALGFWSELFIVLGAVQSYAMAGLGYMVGMAALLMLALGVTAAYSFVTMRRIFYGQPRSELGDLREVIDPFKLSMLAIAILGFALFIVVNPMISGVHAWLKLILGQASGGVM